MAEAKTGSNDVYFEKYERIDDINRKRKRRVNPYDPNASKEDIAYQDRYYGN